MPRALGRNTDDTLETLPLFGGTEPEAKLKQDALGKRTYTGFNARWDEKHG